MGLTDYWNKVQPYLDPGNLLAGGPKHTDAGTVGGARPQDAWALQPIPGTNYTYDPVSGQTYIATSTDPNTGQKIPLGASQVAAAPNLAQQVSSSTGLEGLYTDQYLDAAHRAAATRTGQNALGENYRDVIAGTAPSVAEQQLAAGMGRIATDQTSMAAGANGQNSFAARRAAAQNVARAQGDLSGQLALTRANETAAARSGLAGLYNSESQYDATAGTTAAGGGLGYGKNAEEAESDRIGANQKADEEYNKQRASVIQGGSDTVRGLYS